jgi:hypothetical protein
MNSPALTLLNKLVNQTLRLADVGGDDLLTAFKDPACYMWFGEILRKEIERRIS